MKKTSIIMTLVALIGIPQLSNAVQDTSKIHSDVDAAFKFCQDKIKTITGFESKFPSKKKSDSLNWAKDDYLATLKQVNQYYADKLTIVGNILKKRDEQIKDKIDSTKIDETERDLGGEINAFVMGCKNSVTAIDAQVKIAKPSFTDKVKGIFK